MERGKPYPDMARLACLELGLPAHEVVVIGDSVGDMEMGHSVGSALQIFMDEDGHFPIKPATADVMIRTFDEIRLV